MGTPENHLPPLLSDKAIRDLMRDVGLPTPISTEPLKVSAAYHSIYKVHFAASDGEALRPARARNPDGTTTLVLRVAGRHLPGVKTANEVAVMRWVRAKTRIPVPAVVRFDDSADNAVGHEYTLLERGPGRSVDAMYDAMSDGAKERLVEALADVLVELNGHEWDHVGGLRVDGHGAAAEVVPGPVLDDTFWTEPDVAELWTPVAPGMTARELNPAGPYASHAAFAAAYLECYARAMDAHPTLAWLREPAPAPTPPSGPAPERLRHLATLLDTSRPESPSSSPLLRALASSRLILAHKDLHLANVMATPEGELTAVLDWEFAGVVPAPRWDPARAFLWDGRPRRVWDDDAARAARAEKDRLWRVFERALDRRGVRPWWREGSDEDQRVVADVWTVLGHARALVEVCPRGQRADAVEGWRATMDAALTRLGA